MNTAFVSAHRVVEAVYPPGYWQWREMFAEALDQRFHRIEHVDEMVCTGARVLAINSRATEAAKFFTNGRAAALAEIRRYPTGAMDVHGLVAAGDVEAIVELIPTIEAWGEAMGCIGAVIESRPAWARIMKKHGYDVFQTAVRKEL